MKKNISINIGGIIFHIEEDGYEKLKVYLDSINRYFSTYSDSKEILADIENRIAEIFFAKLSETKQVITFEDVNALMLTMGGVEDFKAVEEEEDILTGTVPPQSSANNYKSQEQHSQHTYTNTPHRKLYKSPSKKLLGGVAGGIAEYFGIDPIWVRLLFVLFVIGYGFGIILYIVLWAVLPTGENLAETSNAKIKKFFRNPDDKVLGGVASGIASYFSADPTAIRILFVLLVIPGGFGFFLYLILWLITPEAKSLTDKMEMKGEPVTLSNIESNIKQNLNLKEEGEESTLTKIVLFPFRLIAMIISGLGRVLGPLAIFLGHTIRIFTGVLFIIISASLLIALVTGLGVLLGILNEETFIHANSEFPIGFFIKDIPDISSIAAFLILIIPTFSIGLLGIALIARRRILSNAVSWSMFGVWIISIFVLAITLPSYISNFRSDATERVEKVFSIAKTPYITLNKTGYDDFRKGSLKITFHNDSTIRVLTEIEARGKNRKEALENAKMVIADVDIQDSIVTFNSNYEIPEDAVFRAQEVRHTLYMPIGKPFIMDEDLGMILRSTLGIHGYYEYQLSGNKWMFTRDGLECITCREDKDTDETYNYNADATVKVNGRESSSIANFQTLSISGAYKVNIRKGKEFKVQFSGDQDDIDEIETRVIGNELRIYREDNVNFFKDLNDRVKIEITMPTLQSAELTGAIEGKISGFDSENLDLQVTGASIITFEGQVSNINADVTGSSTLKLIGSGESLRMDISGASGANAFEYKVRTADLNVVGASYARVYATETLDMDVAGASSVKYKGNPMVSQETSGFSKINKE